MSDLKGVPSWRIAQCEFCGDNLDKQADGVHQYTTGWVKNRSGGGGHGVSLAAREDKWAHGYCVDRMSRHGMRQGTLV